MLNPEFDPYQILEHHEQVLNELIIAHNERAGITERLAQLTEALADQNNQLIERTERLEDELNRIYNYIGEKIK